MENKTSTNHETGNDANRLLAAGLLSKGDIIVSNKNGKELSCYTAPHHVFIGNGETPIRTEYYLWDAEKKKSKKFKENEIRTMLEKNWSVKPKMIANEFENALFDLVNKFCKDGLSKPDLIKKNGVCYTKLSGFVALPLTVHGLAKLPNTKLH